MKKVLLLLGVGLLLVSCEVIPQDQENTSTPPVSDVRYAKGLEVEYIGGYLKTSSSNTDSGFYRIKLSDGKEILVYKEGYGVSMIQLK